MSRILVIGDSHTNAFMAESSRATGGFILEGLNWTKHRHFNMYMNRVGPRLAFTFLDHLESFKHELRKLNATKDDVLLLSYGEIDCRAHLRNRCLPDFSNYKEVVEACVDKYIAGINVLKLEYPNVFVWAATPPRKDEPFKNDFPYYGTYEERVTLVKTFNEMLSLKIGRDHFLTVEHILLHNNEAVNRYYLDFIHLHPLQVQNEVNNELQKIWKLHTNTR